MVARVEGRCVVARVEGRCVVARVEKRRVVARAPFFPLIFCIHFL